MIYLDHNATTPLDPRVLAAMEPHLRESWGNPSSPYRFGKEARLAVERARARIAVCLGCKPSELLFTSGGTEADNLALRGTARARAGRIVCSAVEHHAVRETCRALETEGRALAWLPVDAEGRVSPRELDARLGEETALVSVMHANNETGVIQPVAELARIAHARGALFHTDAVQTLGKLPLRLGELGVDLAAFSGHKLHGPKGIGLLYVREGTALAPLLTGGGQERGLRAGTENVPAIVGLAEAVALCWRADAAAAIAALRDAFEREVVSGIEGVRVNGAGAARVPNTSSLSLEGVDGESVVLGLELAGICVATGSACSTGDPEPSHVLLAMGRSPREAQGSIRVSLGAGTTPEELARTAAALRDTIVRLRAISSL